MPKKIKQATKRLVNGAGHKTLWLVLVAGLLLAVPADVSAQPKIYWTDYSASVIRRANLDGSNVETVLTAAGGVSGPKGIAIDHVDGRMYWTELTRIKRAGLDGSGVQTLVSSDLYSSNGIDVWEQGRKIYFTDSEGDRMGRCDLDGSGFQILVSAQRNPIGIDVDHEGGKVYWAISNGYDGIRRMNLDGSGPVEDIVSGQSWPLDVAVHRPSGRIYFTDQDYGTVKSANLDGSDLTTLVTGLSNPYPIDAYNGFIYWTDWTAGTIERAAMDGTGHETLISGLPSPRGLAIFIPEPSALGLLAFGGLALIRRKRQA